MKRRQEIFQHPTCSNTVSFAAAKGLLSSSSLETYEMATINKLKGDGKLITCPECARLHHTNGCVFLFFFLLGPIRFVLQWTYVVRNGYQLANLFIYSDSWSSHALAVFDSALTAHPFPIFLSIVRGSDSTTDTWRTTVSWLNFAILIWMQFYRLNSGFNSIYAATSDTPIVRNLSKCPTCKEFIQRIAG